MAVAAPPTLVPVVAVPVPPFAVTTPLASDEQKPHWSEAEKAAPIALAAPPVAEPPLPEAVAFPPMAFTSMSPDELQVKQRPLTPMARPSALAAPPIAD